MREAKKATNPDCKPTLNKKTFAFEVYRVSQECGFADDWQKIPQSCLFPPLHFSIKRGGEGEEADRMRDSQPALRLCFIT